MDDMRAIRDGWGDPADHEATEYRAATADMDYEEGEAADDPPTDPDSDYPLPGGGGLRADLGYEEGEAADDPPTDPDTDYPGPPPTTGSNGH